MYVETHLIISDRYVHEGTGVFVRVPLTLKEAYEWFSKSDPISSYEDLHTMMTIASWLCVQNCEGDIPLTEKSPLECVKSESLMAWMSISCFMVCREASEIFDILQETLCKMSDYDNMDGPKFRRFLTKKGLRRLKNHSYKQALIKSIVMSQQHLKQAQAINNQFDQFDLFEQPLFNAIDTFKKYSGRSNFELIQCVPEQWRAVLIKSMNLIYTSRKKRKFDFYENFKFNFTYDLVVKRHVEFFNFLHGGIYFVDKTDVSSLHEPFLDLKSSSFLLGVETMEKLLKEAKNTNNSESAEATNDDNKVEDTDIVIKTEKPEKTENSE